jgi:hypothetical protein
VDIPLPAFHAYGDGSMLPRPREMGGKSRRHIYLESTVSWAYIPIVHQQIRYLTKLARKLTHIRS